MIEIPTPRWTAYDAKYCGVRLGDEVPMTTLERAYTSPIWYTPSPWITTFGGHLQWLKT